MKKESILVVEDEDIMRESLVDWFSSEDHKVDAAADGDNALKDINLEDYDVMIVDLKLPGRDGLSVLKIPKQKSLSSPPTPRSTLRWRRCAEAPSTTCQSLLRWSGFRPR